MFKRLGNYSISPGGEGYLNLGMHEIVFLSLVKKLRGSRYRLVNSDKRYSSLSSAIMANDSGAEVVSRPRTGQGGERLTK